MLIVRVYGVIVAQIAKEPGSNNHRKLELAMLVPVLQMHQLVPQMKMIVLQQLVIHIQVVVQLDIDKMILMYHVLELLV
tara:strand:- start:227 stop:463 length:237 start_codon:yes stop_codon:yes gene_type:complete